MPRIHFIGIGGYSMSGLAEVWKSRGWVVTGSDARRSSRTERLVAHGIPVFYGHRAEHVEGADVVVYTTDVPQDNPELVAARERGIEIRHRSDLLADVLNQGRGVAVTGTHGKTTTSTLIGTLFLAAGTDPTVLLGGELDAFDGSARVGQGAFVVAEADESDASFLKYRPEIAVVTNIEPEHLEHYGHDFQNVRQAFTTFASQVKAGGALVLCADDAEASALPVPASVRRVLYGLRRGDVHAGRVRLAEDGQRFSLYAFGTRVGEVELPLPGRHNVQNTLGAVAATLAAGLPLTPGLPALRQFKNAHRRFEEHYRGQGILVVDDYAHHPTEIRAVLAAARERRPKRVIAVFQPQRYTRTANLFEEFVRAFDDADLVLITDIYSPPGEVPIPGVSGASLAERVNHRHGRARHVRDLVAAEEELLTLVEDGDLVVTMGAGDVYRVAEGLAARLKERRAG